MQELNKTYSTTRRVFKAHPQEMAELVKQTNKPEDKFETVLFLPEGESRQGEGGLRIKGFFKVGGIISANDDSPSTPHPSPEAKPLITVVTVVFNGEKFLEETIHSVINQTYDNVEYIIIDGGSTDGTLDIIKKYEHAIDYWVSEKDKGIYDAMNKGISLSLGKIIGLLNADDFYESDALDIAIDSFLSNIHTNMVAGAGHQLSDLGKVLRQSSTSLLRVKMTIFHPSLFVKASLYKKVGLFDDSFKVSGDYDFTSRCLLKFKEKIFLHPQPFTNMRLGGISYNNPVAINENGIVHTRFSGALFANMIRYARILRKKIRNA